MSILWEKEIAGSRYEVRQAGRTKRLYADGVFHSQYNPDQPIGGSLWDLLFLPAFFYPPHSLKRVLVLGVGGGAVIHLYQRFLKPQQIVGVEINPHHLYIARRFFSITQDNVKLLQADAINWVAKYKGPPFDIVIDDLFGEQQGQPVRAVAADKNWMLLLNNLMTDNGMLVTNFVSRKEFKQCAYFNDRNIQTLFNNSFQITGPQYENAVGAFLKKPSTQRILRKHLTHIARLNPALKPRRLRFAIRRA